MGEIGDRIMKNVDELARLASRPYAPWWKPNVFSLAALTVAIIALARTM